MSIIGRIRRQFDRRKRVDAPLVVVEEWWRELWRLIKARDLNEHIHWPTDICETQAYKQWDQRTTQIRGTSYTRRQDQDRAFWRALGQFILNLAQEKGLTLSPEQDTIVKSLLR